MTTHRHKTSDALRRAYAYAEKQLSSGVSPQALRETLLSKRVSRQVVDSVIETLITEKPPLPVKAESDKAESGRLIALIRALALTLSPLAVTLSRPLGSILLLVGILGPELTLGDLPRGLWLGICSRFSSPSLPRNRLLLKLGTVFATALFAPRLEAAVSHILYPLLGVVVYLSVFLLQTLGLVARQDANLLIFGGVADHMIGVTFISTRCLWPAFMLVLLGKLQWLERAAVCVSVISTAVLCNVFWIVVTALFMESGSSMADDFYDSTLYVISSSVMACFFSYMAVIGCRLLVGHHVAGGRAGKQGSDLNQGGS
jgi:hypothetical protein